MEISSVIGKAVEMVQEANVPSDLRAVAFAKIVDALVAGSAGATVPGAASGAIASSSNIRQSSQSSGEDPIPALAVKLGLDEATLREVYEWSEGELRLILAPARFAGSRASAAQQIALLVAAGRQLSGVDAEWTQAEVVRRVVQDYGKFDSSNFAGSMKAMGDDFAVKGTGAQRSFKITRLGIEHAKQLLLQVTGGVRPVA
jgi:hypothetical protein